jgi:hypothetical protein
MNRILFPLVCTLILFASAVQARDVQNKQVHFEHGADCAVIQESITGYQAVNYLVSAKAGQSMVVALTTDNNADYFNVYVPGKGPGDQAVFIGTQQGNRYKRRLAADGEYTISVFLMRNAARRNERAGFTLNIEIR